MKFKYIIFILVLCVILGLTIQSVQGTMNLSEGMRYAVISICDKINVDSSNKWWNNSAHFRKIGHVFEYFILGCAVYTMVKKIRLSLLVCIGISIIDQIVKIYIPVRHFDWMDMVFDMTGYFFGIMFLRILDAIRAKSDSSK